MSVSFGEKNAAEFYFGDTAAAEIYFGDALVWSGASRLVMGNITNVCIEFIPETDIIASSQNPVTISVFMNTDSYTTTNPPMWVIDEAGVTVGFSNVGTVGPEEVIKKQAGYKRTNTFTDNMLFLTAGKKYYICYRVSQWDQGAHYFAYYNKETGNYKNYHVGNESSAVVNMSAYNYIGELGAANVFSGLEAAMTASENDMFLWEGQTVAGSLTANNEYVRNNTQLTSAYNSSMNCSSTNKFDVLWNVLTADENDVFINFPSFSNPNGSSGVIQRTDRYTNHVVIPPSQEFFTCSADAYKYIFDPAIHLSDNDSQGKAVVWGNSYVYTSGELYERGSQYLGYSMYEARVPGDYIETVDELIKPSANELFYFSGALRLRNSVAVAGTGTIEDGNNFDDAFRAVAAATNNGKAIISVINGASYQWDNAVYEQNGSWQNKITTALIEEPESPATNDVYWKAATTEGWATDQYGGKITANCLVKYNGQYWSQIYSWQESDYFNKSAVTILYSDANTNGILNQVPASNLYSTYNISNLFTSIQGSTGFTASPVSSDKKHYLEINGVEV